MSIAEWGGAQVPSPQFSLLGDGTLEADRLVAASTLQRRLAADRLESVLPGYNASGRADSCGLDTPTVLAPIPGLVVLVDAPAHIDAFLAAGDLGSDRCQIIDDRTNRGQAVRAELASPRPGSTASVNLDPFLAAAELRSNHTIVLNEAANRLSPAAADLCDDISIAFRSHIQLNCYVSLGEAPGFGVHWDDHDVLVIQVAGRKYWEVEAPTELAPVKGVTPRGGSGNAVWSGVLSPGQVLAIPRGWPHSVQGLEGEVSVHLTVSIGRPSGLGVLGQLSPGSFAFDTPFDEGTLDHAFAAWHSKLIADPRNGPIAVLAAQASEYSDNEIRVVWLGGVVFVRELCADATLSLVGPAGTFAIPRGSAEGLAFALERQWWTRDELCAAAELDVESAVALIDTLGGAGLVQLRPAT